MNAAPRNVQRLWAALGVFLLIGAPAYVYFLKTDSYDLLVLFFHNAGAAYFLGATAVGAYFVHRVRTQFDANEPMHLTWTLVLLSLACQFAGLTCSQVLGMNIAWNPLVRLGALSADRATLLHDIGLVVNGPVALLLMGGGLTHVLILKRRLKLVGSLTAGDRIFIAVVVGFTLTQIGEMARMYTLKRSAVTLTQVLLWFTDPLLAVLLVEAVSIRRLVMHLGEGLVARCWWMMALGVAFTSAGNAYVWLENWGVIPLVLYPVGWFLWFFPVTAYACAPCYQLNAIRQAHAGSYTVTQQAGHCAAPTTRVL